MDHERFRDIDDDHDLCAISPEAALSSNFGETLDGPLAEIIVRNWGALIALVGIILKNGMAFCAEQSSRAEGRDKYGDCPANTIPNHNCTLQQNPRTKRTPGQTGPPNEAHETQPIRLHLRPVDSIGLQHS